MECIAPDEITEEQLLAYADGEADRVTVDHIRRCLYCAERARAYATDQLAVRALFYRIQCPEAHTLGEFHLGILPAAEQSAIEDHLESCPFCAEEVANLEHFLEEVPVAPAVPSPQRQLKRLVARLAPPTSLGLETQELALGFRGTAAALPDVYRAEDIKLVVGLEADGLRAGRKMLLGFTTREDQTRGCLSGALVQLNRRGETVAIDQVDTLGNFVFSDLISGRYELLLVTDQERVVIEKIVI